MFWKYLNICLETEANNPWDRTCTFNLAMKFWLCEEKKVCWEWFLKNTQKTGSTVRIIMATRWYVSMFGMLVSQQLYWRVIHGNTGNKAYAPNVRSCVTDFKRSLYVPFITLTTHLELYRFDIGMLLHNSHHRILCTRLGFFPRIFIVFLDKSIWDTEVCLSELVMKKPLESLESQKSERKGYKI